MASTMDSVVAKAEHLIGAKCTGAEFSLVGPVPVGHLELTFSLPPQRYSLARSFRYSGNNASFQLLSNNRIKVTASCLNNMAHLLQAI
ncbi:hypothetical protein ACFSR7_05970 [Cohnella sp. GCM10020058]|uniref:hypothetical protein n=1 Tax=Cohnella sp. GCM10020058 TaxID=3317330 RepID=UPI003634C1F2